jgi:formylglycine-generating enzyme
MRSTTHLALVPVLLMFGWGAAAPGNVVIETVPVSDAGNTGELSGGGAGGYGPDRVCGAVGYAYRLGKYEVTAGQYTGFLNQVAGVDAYGLYNAFMSNANFGSGITRSGSGTVDRPYTYSVASGFANRPVNYVSWGDAARFTNWLHNGQPTGVQGPSTTESGAYTLNGATSSAALLAVTRESNATWAIPTEDEWYKAAYYKGGSTSAGYFHYSTSGDAAPGRDLADGAGNNANYYIGNGLLPINTGTYTTSVGQFLNSDSPYGTFDQGGNVWEWNEAVLGGAARGLRGGSFDDGSYVKSLHASFRSGIYPAYESSSVGFRVAEVPEPGALALLALGGWVVGWRRRAARQ